VADHAKGLVHTGVTTGDQDVASLGRVESLWPLHPGGQRAEPEAESFSGDPSVVHHC
jgi:hypothetical protein